jgi:hypothetical protein
MSERRNRMNVARRNKSVSKNANELLNNSRKRLAGRRCKAVLELNESVGNALLRRTRRKPPTCRRLKSGGKRTHANTSDKAASNRSTR